MLQVRLNLQANSFPDQVNLSQPRSVCFKVDHLFQPGSTCFNLDQFRAGKNTQFTSRFLPIPNTNL